MQPASDLRSLLRTKTEIASLPRLLIYFLYIHNCFFLLFQQLLAMKTIQLLDIPIK